MSQLVSCLNLITQTFTICSVFFQVRSCVEKSKLVTILLDSAFVCLVHEALPRGYLLG